MTVSELIATLQDTLDVDGDIEVKVETSEHEFVPVDGVTHEQLRQVGLPGTETVFVINI